MSRPSQLTHAFTHHVLTIRLRLLTISHCWQIKKVRQSWNKYNLYNLARLNIPPSSSRTLFQQKWTAKASTRAYHGEQILEKQWHSLYTTRLPAVAPLDHRYLAQNDGSEQAAGRGSGVDVRPDDRPGGSKARTPYEQMTYFPMERRLDVAIFRALFASSTRQARQFVRHGFVKVNGKKVCLDEYGNMTMQVANYLYFLIIR